MRALSCQILKYKGSTCANSGISEKYDEILLLCDSGNYEVNGDEPNLCRLVERYLWGEDYYYIEPVAQANGVGYMSSGAVVYTPDSRFPFKYPLQLHDRTETQEEYDIYSS